MRLDRVLMIVFTTLQGLKECRAAPSPSDVDSKLL